MMEESGVQARQCLLEDGVAGGSGESESFKEKGVGLELSHEGSVSKSRVDLESKEDKESWEREVRRSSEGEDFIRYHSAKLDKFIK